MVAYIPLVAWMGVRSFLWYFAASAGLVGLVAWNYIYSKLENPSFLHMVGSLMLNAATLMLVSRWFGPLVLIPGVACASSVIYSLHGRPRWWSVLCAAMGVATVFVPLVLQGLGFVESAYEFRDGQLVVLAIGTDLPAVPTLVALSLGALGMVGAPVIAIGRLRRALYDAEERLHLQAWQLRQLVPEQARDDIAQSQPPRFAT
jgi:serine/threonine-protein kinase